MTFIKTDVDIAIIGAMTEEIEAFIVHLVNVTKYESLNSVYYLGRLSGKQIVVFQSGIGKVGAAISTAFVLENFSPKCLINIGSAGGFAKKLSVGDIVISSEVRYHDVNVTLVGCEYGQVPHLPAAFLADAHLVSIAERSAQKNKDHQVLKGLICTGDVFISSPEIVANIRDYFPQIVAADMEAAAVGHTCYLYNCPFVIIRAISDIVDQHDNQIDFFTFLKIAAKNSADIVIDMIKAL